MNKNIENIQNDFEVTHLSIIPDGTQHNHNYMEIELIEEGKGTQIINGQYFNISKQCISILRPYIDNQSLIQQETSIFDHNVLIQQNVEYNVKCGAIHIKNGKNKNRIYVFLSINDNFVAEKFLDEDFNCESICFFSNYSTKNIHISGSKNNNLNFTNSTILSKDDVLDYYDISTNENIGLPDSFILKQKDFSFYQYVKSENNLSGSFVYNCNISIESFNYRIVMFKLNDKGNEIDLLLSTDKIYISQILPKNEFSIYKLCINPNILDVETRKKILSYNNPLCLTLNDNAYENIKSVFKLLIHFGKNNTIPDKTVKNLVELLFRLYFDESLQTVNTNPFNEIVLMFFLENNRFLSNISLEDFAKHLGYDPGYASRICIKSTGYSFVKYKIHLRLQYARHLILSTKTPISEISIASGFNSLSVFNRFFKKETGLSPSEYRKLYQNNKL